MRRVVIGVLSAAVVAAGAGVTTWATAEEAPQPPVRLVVGMKAGADGFMPLQKASGLGAKSLDSGAAQKAMAAALNAQTLEVSAARRDRIIETLRNDPNVAYVEVDRKRKAFGFSPNDPMYTQIGSDGLRMQSEVDQVKLPEAWGTTTGLASTTIAVLDTGVTPTGDLAGAVSGGYNYVDNNNDTSDDAGHGTVVASLIAARGNNGQGMAGACWWCTIMPVKVLDWQGNGNDSDIAKGIVFATNSGADIINMSLGGSESSKVLADAVAYANLRGVLVVAAAGNEGRDPAWQTVKQYPAAYPGVVSVGATARNTTERADFSSFNRPGDTWVDLAAPGDVVGMNPDGNYNAGEQGTSFAAPIVAGAAGLVKSIHPDYTGWSLERALLESATPIGGNGWVTRGMLNAEKALTIGTDATSPTISGIARPGHNQRVRGKTTVTATGVGDSWSGVRNVDLYVDGRYQSQDRSAPYDLPYNTAGRNGTVVLEVRVYDKAGNRRDFRRTIIADNKAPAVKISKGPKHKAKVKGTVKLTATASDAAGLRRVELLINGKVKQTDTAAPFKFSFKAKKYRSGMKIQVRAVDLAGNTKTDKARTYKR
ncbi:S8 family serine peptidase [Actinoplanes sp. NPDC051859]|uniref:S8 family serine peptidase n=1 Tax=Actinoplanes sp. NPDC051859 TaxID=3363909 RepID=UPI00378962FB